MMAPMAASPLFAVPITQAAECRHSLANGLRPAAFAARDEKMANGVLKLGQDQLALLRRCSDQECGGGAGRNLGRVHKATVIAGLIGQKDQRLGGILMARDG